MDYLVCYNIQSSNKGSATADIVLDAPDLTVKSVNEMRDWLKKNLRSKGFKAPSVVFTNIIKLDQP